MAETEEYFPRGGKKPTAAIYKPSANFLGTYEKAGKKSKKPKKKSEGDDGYLSDEFNSEFDKSISNCAVGLSYKTVKEGVLILGRIRQVMETKMQVALPCKMHGTVMACHISEPYNKLLEDYVNDKVESVRELSKMFQPGQYVATKVLEVEGLNVMLSLMPQHVQAGRLHGELHKGTLLQAAVSSVEDHGFVMDLGIPNTRAFLPKDDANEEIELDVGVITWCTIKNVTPSSDNSIVSVSCRPEAIGGAISRKGGKHLLPGTAVDFTVDKALENGIEGHIFGDVTCYVQRAHADSVKGKKPALGQKIRARILYELPTRKTPFLTMRNIFEKPRPDLAEEQAYKIGDIVEEAKVIKVTKRSIIFSLGKRAAGVMSVRRARAADELDDELALAKVYPLGSSHRVRVLSYNLCDYSFAVSDEAAVLRQQYFTLDQVSVGCPLEGTVKDVTEVGLNVQVGRLRGFVPKTHISDSGFVVDPKKPNKKNILKKFKVGQEISARALSLDLETGSVVLTMKPSLLADDAQILADYKDAVVGKTYIGFIQYIKNYLLVSFFNKVIALVPKNFVSKEPIENLTDAFHVGQIVTCTILKVDPEAKKMTATLLKEMPADKKHDKTKKRKKEDDGEDVPKKKSKKEKEEKSKKDKKKDKRKADNSEESDAIETDIQDDGDEILTTADLQLLDLSDLDTPKQWKKRVLSLSKAINNRIKRIYTIDKKLEAIEEKGLDKTNKKFHTAMHTEKIIVEERIKKLAEAFQQAQEKMESFPKHEKTYKTTKEIRAEKKKLKQEQNGNEIKKETAEDKNIENKIKEKVKEIKVADVTSAIEAPSVKEFWAPREEVEKEVESSSSEDEETEAPKKKRKKLTTAEKVAKAREEDEKLRKLEAAAAAGGAPSSVEQFERAILATPDAADLWLAYAALHLQSTEIEKARAVCRRALTSISFREEGERLNIWIAMLNLEHRFGTKESQQKTLEEALQMNDAFSVHSKLLDILSDTAKMAELLALVDLMMKKYRRNPETYRVCGAVAYKTALVDKARQVMQKAVGALEKKDHVSVLVHFALLERDHGSRDRAEAIFEQILGVFPQRVDVCSAYVDMLHKAGDPEAVRQVMERMTSQKLPARKMKILYRKWIEVEEKIGDEDQVEKVRQKAAQFIESAKF